MVKPSAENVERTRRLQDERILDANPKPENPDYIGRPGGALPQQEENLVESWWEFEGEPRDEAIRLFELAVADDWIFSMDSAGDPPVRCKPGERYRMYANKVVADFIAHLSIQVYRDDNGTGVVHLTLGSPLAEADWQRDPESFAPEPVAFEETCLADDSPSYTTTTTTNPSGADVARTERLLAERVLGAAPVPRDPGYRGEPGGAPPLEDANVVEISWRFEGAWREEAIRVFELAVADG